MTNNGATHSQKNTVTQKAPHAIKVVHLVSGGDSGGAKSHILNLCRALQEHIPLIVLCLVKDQFYYEGRDMGVNITTMEQRYRFDISVAFKLKKMIDEEGYTILHCHGARANFIGAFIKKFTRARVITTMHSDYKLDFLGNKYKYVLYTSLNAFSLRFFDYYIAISDSFKHMLMERGFEADQIYVVYNGRDFKKIRDPELDKPAVLQKYGLSIPGEAHIVGTITRLEPVKGLELFLYGAKHILEKQPAVHFLIAGSGDSEKKLKKLTRELGIDENVHFLGYINQPEEIMQIVDVNVLTSHSESFPYVLLEGAYFKKPTVTTNVGGINALIIDEQTGLLVQSRRTEEFAEKVRRLLNEQEFARALGERLYRHARERFSLENMVNNHLDIYQQLIQKGE